MKKSAKSSKNKKFSVVVFYGTFAVGKYTTANEFYKRTGYKFFHNHHAFDLARSLFERETINLSRLYETINFTVLKEIAYAKINAVTTHAFSKSYVSKTGLSDPNYMRKMQSIIERGGGTVYFIHLKADKKVLMKRVRGESRKKFRKLKDAKILKGILDNKKKDWVSGAPVKNNLEIDNSKMSPRKVAEMVIKHYKLK